MYNHLKPSYEEIHNACVDMAEQIEIDKLNIKQVAGVARGGLLPGVILSHILKLPLLLIDYSSKGGKGDDKNHKNNIPLLSPANGPILIVDDICDSGKTLREIYEHYQFCNVEVYTAVLYHKLLKDKQLFIPDYVWRSVPEDSGWVIFPYERNEYLSNAEVAYHTINSLGLS